MPPIAPDSAAAATPAPRRRKLARRLGLLLASILVGIAGGGYFLDESPPDVTDLAIPPPTLAEPNPFAALGADHPVSLNRLGDLFTRLGLPRNPHDHDRPDHFREAWANDDELRETLRTVREWASAFEAAFAHGGGDPHEGIITRSTRIAASPFDDSGLGAIGTGRTWNEPYPFHELLGKTSTAERALGLQDDAMSHLTLALQLESWQVLHVPEALDLGRLSRLLDHVRALIESGDVWEVRDPRVVEGLRGWHVPPELLVARVRQQFAERAAELRIDEYWDTLVADPPPRHRLKKNRAVRRLAGQVRDLIARPLEPTVVTTPESSALVRAWIDPHGDTALALEFDYLHNLQRDHLDLRRESELVRLALAIVRYETSRGNAPESLDDLVPDLVAEIPRFPLATGAPTWDPRARVLSLPRGEDLTDEIRIPAAAP